MGSTAIALWGFPYYNYTTLIKGCWQLFAPVDFCIFMQKSQLLSMPLEFVRYKYS
jgi:hypothetical protein